MRRSKKDCLKRLSFTTTDETESKENGTLIFHFKSVKPVSLDLKPDVIRENVLGEQKSTLTLLVDSSLFLDCASVTTAIANN